MGLTVTVPPPAGSYVVGLDALKLHMNIKFNDDDDIVIDMLNEAQEFVETQTRQQIFTATKKLTLDRFPGHCQFGQAGGFIVAPGIIAAEVGEREIILPTPPLQSVSGVTYIWQGQTLTLSTSLYGVDTSGKPGRIVLNGGQSWPATDPIANAVTIEFVCGYGAIPSSVPRRFAMAVKWLAAHMFENREATGETHLHELPIGLANVLTSLRFCEAHSA